VDANKNENEEVVIGQKEISTEATSSTMESVVQTSTASTTDSTEQEEETTTDVQPSQKMHIVVANSPFSTMDLETHKAKKGSVAVVIPTNYVEKNFSASSSDSPTTVHNTAWENPTTSEITKMTHQVPKSQSQPVRNAITSLPILSENPSASSVPMRMILSSQHQPLHPPSAPVMPSRHIDSSSHMYVSPQAAQSMMRPQTRPNTMIHFIGSMHPSFRPSSSVSMSHMSPPMTHLHAPSMNNMMVPLPSMEQTHQRLPQPFPVTFTNPPSPTFSTQIPESNEQLIDHRSSRLPATTVTTSPSFTSTISSTMEYTPTMDTMDQHENTKPNQSPLMKILNVEETSKTMLAPSSMIPPRTTTVPSLTTDPIFSHYKQPSKPIRGPMYLIIQGHSKVKTYKPTVNKHGVPIENNEIMESATERQLSKLEQLIRENTKNGSVDLAAEKRKLEEKARTEKHVSSRKETLMSLVESGLNGFTVSSSTVAEDERRMSNSVTSIEIN